MPIKPLKLNWQLAKRLIAENTDEIASPDLVRNPTLSVAFVTFNHAPYVRQAMDSVLAQVTDFPIEILIGDDCSSDGTTEILEEYQHAHPETIRLFKSTQRLGAYTGNGRLNAIRNLEASRGSYIALLEGDDYWCDDTKLQQQVDALNTDPSVKGTFHATTCYDGERHLCQSTYNPRFSRMKNRVFQHELIGDKCPFHTSSFVFRQQSMEALLKNIINLQMLDFPLFVRIARDGPLQKIDATMSVYRQNSGGVTTQPLYTSKSRFSGIERETERLVFWQSVKSDVQLKNRQELCDTITHHTERTLARLYSIDDWWTIWRIHRRVFTFGKATALFTSLCSKRVKVFLMNRKGKLSRRFLKTINKTSSNRGSK